MVVTWNPELLDQVLAPGISTFTVADIQDLSAEFPQAPHWMSNHFLNSALGARWSGPLRIHVVTGLLRAQLAFVAYHDARLLSAEYLKGHNPHTPRVKRYFELVGKWESCVHNLQMFIEAFNKFAAPSKAYEAGDNSSEERLCKLANDIKHLGRAPKEEHSIPMWLTNTGLQSIQSAVSYPEVAKMIRVTSAFAERLQHPGGFSDDVPEI